MTIVSFPEGTATVIEEIIDNIGRNVMFMQVTYSGCTYSGDSLDPVTNTSTNSFCPVCSGLYWIPVLSGIEIKAHITWKPSDVLQWESGGQLFTGDCLVKIPYSVDNYTATKNATYIVVDGKKMSKTKKGATLLGVPTINRILMELNEEDKEP